VTESRHEIAHRLAGFGTTIFTEMSALAVQTESVNLGQGFPDTDGPSVVSEAAVAAIRAGANQYPPLPGVPALREAICRHQNRFYGLRVDPDAEVLVTTGATEAIAATMLGLCNPGDEVVCFEPLYDSYAASIAMAGGVRRSVTLRIPDLSFDPQELRAAITGRTKIILLNTPHNPLGKVFTADELQVIADVALEHDLLVVSDEVYEHLVFVGAHVPIATLAGMADRTITISSSGKTFSFTGWKIGWVTARAELVAAVRTAKQFLTFGTGAPFQPAIALALDLGDPYYEDFLNGMGARRDQLVGGLRSLGFEVYEPEGTYFATADIRSIGEEDGIDFCMSLPERAGVVAVPSSVFYDPEGRVGDASNEGKSLIRFAFCKQESVIDEALTRLQRLFP
jgi:N-succinyldiaminopimelate aminotransferase